MPGCQICRIRTHPEKYCHLLRNGTPAVAMKLVIQAKLCVNCFARTHRQEDCKSKFNCLYCNGRHHTMLCTKTEDPNVQHLKPVVQVLMERGDRKIVANLLVHGRSKSCVLKHHIGRRLLAPEEEDRDLQPIMVNMTVPSCPEEKQFPTIFKLKFNIKFPVQPRATGGLLTYLNKVYPLANPEPDYNHDIDGQVGSHLFDIFAPINSKPIYHFGPLTGKKTPFGWLLSGHWNPDNERSVPIPPRYSLD